MKERVSSIERWQLPIAAKHTEAFDMNLEDSIREVREKYQQLGRPLNELQRRHWAALEALRLGRGGMTIVSKALQISPNTIKRGIQEVRAGQGDSPTFAITRIRKPGGGRKSKSLPHDHSTPTESVPNTADPEPHRAASPAFHQCDSHSTPSAVDSAQSGLQPADEQKNQSAGP